MSQTIFAPIPANFNGKTYHSSVSDANLISTATDRRLDTYTDETDLILDTSGNTSVTHVWVKGTGITSVAVVISSVTVASVTRAGYTVENAQGVDVDWKQDGFENYLIDIRDTTNDPLVPRTASRIGLTIGGASAKVYEVAAIDAELTLNAEERFSQFDFTPVWRNWTTHQTITGRIKGIPPLNNEPYRRDLDLTIQYLDNAYHQPLLNFLYANPNFCLIPEYTRYPHILFSEATLPNWEMQVRYLVADLKNHRTLSLRVSEA